MKQHTVNRTNWIEGIGLHTGKHCKVRLLPQYPNCGITVRVNNVDTPLTDTVRVDAPLCTAIATDNSTVYTIEHILAALYGASINNCIIEVIGNEIPILDGSAKPFYDAIVPLVQGVPLLKKTTQSTIRITDGDAWVEFSPGQHTEWHVEIDFPAPIGKQTASYYESQSWIDTIGQARTFGYRKDKELYQSKGLALGATEDTGIVVDSTVPDLRIQNEFAAHKLLDAQGDLQFVGSSVTGIYRGYKPSHRLNYRLALAIREQNG